MLSKVQLLIDHKIKTEKRALPSEESDNTGLYVIFGAVVVGIMTMGVRVFHDHRRMRRRTESTAEVRDRPMTRDRYQFSMHIA